MPFLYLRKIYKKQRGHSLKNFVLHRTDFDLVTLIATEITLKALTYNNEQLLLTLSIKYNEISYNTIIIRERIRRASMMLSHKDNIDTEGSV